MKKFNVSYVEESSGNIWFEAETMEEAQALVDKLRSGVINADELPNFGKKERSYETDFQYLKEVE